MYSRFNIDYTLFFGILLLAIFGMAMVSSVSFFESYQLTSRMVRLGYIDTPYNYFYIKKTVLSFFLGVMILGLVSKIPYGWYERYVKHIFVVGFGLLWVVLLFGDVYNGAKGWLNIPGIPFTLQPAEFFKIAFVLYLAYFLKKKGSQIIEFSQGFIPFILTLGVMVFPIMLQPDFGTILILAPLAVGLFFVAGGRARYIVLLAIIGSIFAWGVYQAGTYDSPADRKKLSYITDRIDNFLTPNQEAIANQSISYQTKQGLIAIGSGGMFGLGFGKSIQKYGYLPETQGDMIFSIIAEEFGLFGITLFLGLYLFIVHRGYRITLAQMDPFPRYVAFGIVSLICIQAFVHIGVNLNIVPLTGVTLPFVSYGGSSLLSLMIGAGILLNISRSASL